MNAREEASDLMMNPLPPLVAVVDARLLPTALHTIDVEIAPAKIESLLHRPGEPTINYEVKPKVVQ